MSTNEVVAATSTLSWTRTPFTAHSSRTPTLRTVCR